MPAAGELSDDVAHEAFGVAEEHESFVFIVKGIVDAGKAGAQTPLDDHDGAGLVGPSCTHFVLSI